MYIQMYVCILFKIHACKCILCLYIYTHNVYTQLYHLCSSAALTGPRFSDTYIWLESYPHFFNYTYSISLYGCMMSINIVFFSSFSSRIYRYTNISKTAVLSSSSSIDAWDIGRSRDSPQLGTSMEQIMEQARCWMEKNLLIQISKDLGDLGIILTHCEASENTEEIARIQSA